MARIPTYQKDLYISDLDRIIGTDGDTNELTTKNFFLGDIAEYVIDKFIDPDAVSFTIPVLRDTGDNLGANATRITGSIMSQDTNPDGTKITIAGLLQADKEVKVKGKLVGGVAQSGQLVLNSSLNATGITIKAPTHENLAGSYSMVLPNDIGVAGAQLTTDGVGELYWAEPEDDNLTFAGDFGQGLIDLDTETFSIVGGDHITTTALGQTLTINIEDVVTGSGTPGVLPLWDASTTGLVDSSVSQYGGTVFVDNNLFVSGSATLSSNIILGSASTTLITQTGTLYLNGPIKDTTNTLGDADQILVSDASGELTFTDIADIAVGSAEVIEIPVKNLQGSALTKGDPVYISGSVGTSGRLEVQLADASNEAKMPAAGLLKQDLGINEEGFVVVTGKLRNLPTAPIDGQTPLPNDVIYVKANGTTGAALTTTKPTGSNLIQNMGKVGRVSTSNDGTFVVSSILRTNDIPNLSPGKIWVGSTGNTIESGFVTLDEGATKLTVDGNLEVTSLTSGYIPFVNPSNVLANSAIYQDSDGHIGINVQPDPEHVFEVFDDRNENLSTDYSFYVTSEVASTPGKGAGGIQARVSDDGGATYSSVVLVPGTTTGDLMSSNPLAFFANSDLDTSSATGFAGNIGTNGNWYLGGTFTTAPTEKLTVEGNVKIIGETFRFNFSDDVQHIFSIVPSTSSFGAGSSTLKFGKNNSVTKGGGIAMGQNLISTGEQSQAFGHGNTASAAQSTVFGTNTTATGAQSFAFGNGADATGGRSFAGGFSSTASGLNSVALGNATTASGANAMTMGATSTASGFNCFSFGLGITNSANASLAVGAYNVDSPGYKFSVGIGNSASNRANGLAVREDGYIILDALKNSSSYNSDIAAAAGGVPLGALYRDGNTVKIRLT